MTDNGEIKMWILILALIIWIGIVMAAFSKSVINGWLLLIGPLLAFAYWSDEANRNSIYNENTVIVTAEYPSRCNDSSIMVSVGNNHRTKTIKEVNYSLIVTDKGRSTNLLDYNYSLLKSDYVIKPLTTSTFCMYIGSIATLENKVISAEHNYHYWVN